MPPTYQVMNLFCINSKFYRSSALKINIKLEGPEIIKEIELVHNFLTLLLLKYPPDSGNSMKSSKKR